MTMGIEWIQMLHPVPQYRFKAHVLGPSSLRAELLSFFSILLTLPPNSYTTIFMDSQSLIQEFHHFSSTSLNLSTRRFLKLKNHDI